MKRGPSRCERSQEPWRHLAGERNPNSSHPELALAGPDWPTGAPAAQVNELQASLEKQRLEDTTSAAAAAAAAASGQEEVHTLQAKLAASETARQKAARGNEKSLEELERKLAASDAERAAASKQATEANNALAAANANKVRPSTHSIGPPASALPARSQPASFLPALPPPQVALNDQLAAATAATKAAHAKAAEAQAAAKEAQAKERAAAAQLREVSSREKAAAAKASAAQAQAKLAAQGSFGGAAPSGGVESGGGGAGGGGGSAEAQAKLTKAQEALAAEQAALAKERASMAKEQAAHERVLAQLATEKQWSRSLQGKVHAPAGRLIPTASARTLAFFRSELNARGGTTSGGGARARPSPLRRSPCPGCLVRRKPQFMIKRHPLMPHPPHWPLLPFSRLPAGCGALRLPLASALSGTGCTRVASRGTFPRGLASLIPQRHVLCHSLSPPSFNVELSLPAL